MTLKYCSSIVLVLRSSKKNSAQLILNTWDQTTGSSRRMVLYRTSIACECRSLHDGIPFCLLTSNRRNLAPTFRERFKLTRKGRFNESSNLHPIALDFVCFTRVLPRQSTVWLGKPHDLLRTHIIRWVDEISIWVDVVRTAYYVNAVGSGEYYVTYIF